MDSNLVYSIFVTFYSNSLITVQVWYSNGPNISSCWMVVWKPQKKCLFNGLKCPVFEFPVFEWSA